jgi:cytochrome bd-type quinol oxidase subunit 2
MEKVAWVEMIISVAAVTAATALFPWLGDGATGAFGLLGLLGFTIVLVRRRGNQVVVDERDREIEARATKFGIWAAWMTLFLSLIAATMWASYSQTNAISTGFLTWLIWIQFAICYGVRGTVAVLMYRRQQGAT